MCFIQNPEQDGENKMSFIQNLEQDGENKMCFIQNPEQDGKNKMCCIQDLEQMERIRCVLHKTWSVVSRNLYDYCPSF